MASMSKDVEIEVKIDLDALAYYISRILDTDELCKFINVLIEEYCDLEVNESVFLSQLKT